MSFHKLISSMPMLKNTASPTLGSPFENDPQLHAVVFRRRVIGFSFLATIGCLSSFILLDSSPTSNTSNEIEASQRGLSAKSPTTASNIAYGKITHAKMRPIELSVAEPIPPMTLQDKPRVIESTAVKYENDRSNVSVENHPASTPPASSVQLRQLKNTPIISKRDTLFEAQPTLDNNVKIVVQVAALASEEKVKALQWKLKGVGVKSFTENATTASGTLIRVRVGPFKTRAEADEANRRLSVAGLAGSIVTD